MMTMMNTKIMPCGCIMEWEEGVFKLSLCRRHGIQFEQKEVIDYGGSKESTSMGAKEGGHPSPYG